MSRRPGTGSAGARRVLSAAALASLVVGAGVAAADTDAPPAPAPAYAIRCPSGQHPEGGRCVRNTPTSTTPSTAGLAPQAPPNATSPPTLVRVPQRKPTRKRRHLLQPKVGAVLHARRPLVVRWLRDPRARYYNVQLYRKRTKLATMWPTARRVRLPGRKLAVGRYQLVIWSGVGLKSRARYAKTPWVAERLRVVS